MEEGDEGRDGAAELAGVGPCFSFREEASAEVAVGRESPTIIPAAEDRSEAADEEEDDDFEFAFVISNADRERGYMTADEMFSNGVVRPVYSVLNRYLLPPSSSATTTAEAKAERLPLRRLLMEEKESESETERSSLLVSKAVDDLEGVPRDSYCVWSPRSTSVPPSPCRKSVSTGSSFRLRFRDLVVGRSNSDGNAKLVLLAAPEPSPRSSPKERGRKEKAEGVRELDIVAAHRLYYARKSSGAGRPWRTFLPYRPDLVGQFGGGGVNGGFRWSQNPS